MAIVLDGSTGISSIGTLTGVTSISSTTADTPVILQDSSSNSNTCRAWVNFNGTSTVAIRADFNVSSITDNGTGDYTVNFSVAMPDANYQYSGSFAPNYAVVYPGGISINTTPPNESAPTTSSFRFACPGVNSTLYDPKYINIAVFR